MSRVPAGLRQPGVFLGFVLGFILMLAGPGAHAQLNGVSAVHTSTDQKSIILTLSGNLGANYTCVGACATAWTINFTNPNANQPATSVTGASGTNTVTINFATAVGIDPATHKGQTVRVSHTNDGIINTVTNLASVNNRHLACGDFTATTFSDASGTCAPVNPSSFMVFSVAPVARNSSHWAMASNTGRIVWGSGGSNNVINMRETNSTGGTATDAYFVSIYTADEVPDFVYPSNDNVCGYSSQWNVRLAYAGVGGLTTNCGLLQALQTQVYASHNNDDTGLSNGTVNADVLLPATIANSDLVCQGTNANMTFTDNTQINCRAQTSPIPTNDKVRWVRVVYGSQDLGSGAVAGRNIPDVHVNGVEVTNSTGVLQYPGGYSPPTTPWGTPDAFGVVQLTTPVTGNRGILETITTTTVNFANQVVGQKFWVRIDYWNACNPYTFGNLANNQRSIENEIEIVTIPTAPSAVPQLPVCSGTTPSNFAITGATANSTVRWYTAATGGTQIGADGLSDGSGNASLPVTSAPSWVNNTTAAVHTVYASYASTPGGITCQSPRTAVTRTVREELDNVVAGLRISATSAVCAGTNNVTYTIETNPGGVATNAPTQTVGGATQYVWTLPTGFTLASGSLTGTTHTITVNIGAAATTGNVTAILQYQAAGPGPAPIRCDSDPLSRSQTVNPLPVITGPANQAVCDDAALTFTPTMSVASTYDYSWTFGNAAATLTGMSNGTNTSPFSQTINNNDHSTTVRTVEYYIVPRNTTTLCVGASFTTTVTVRPSPQVNSVIRAPICSNVDAGGTFPGSVMGSVGTDRYNIITVNPGTAVLGSGHPGAFPSNNQMANAISNDQFTNTTTGQATALYTVRPVSSAANGTCVGDAFNVTIPINPEPQVPTPANPYTTICSRSPVAQNFPAAVAGVATATFNVTAPTGTGIVLGTGHPTYPAAGLLAADLQNDTFINTTTADINVTYSVRPVSADGCIGNPFNLIVRVRPEPVTTPTDPFRTVCSDTPVGVSFPASTSGAATNSYNVVSVNTGSATIVSGVATGTGFTAADLQDDIFNNVTSSDVTVVYNIVPVSANNCPGQAFNLNVVVRAEPVVSSINPAAICSDQAYGTNFPASSTVSADGYIIQSLALNGMTAGGTVPGTFPSTTLTSAALADDFFTNITGSQQNAVYTVTPIHNYTSPAATCAGNDFTITLPVNSGPSVSNQNIGTLCSRATLATNFGSTTNGVAANTYEIVNMVTTGVTAGGTVAATGATGLVAADLADDFFINTGTINRTVTYTVRPRNTANGCPGPTFTVSVTVRPEPTVSDQTATICSDVQIGADFNPGTNITATVYNVTSIDNPGGLASTNVVTGDQAITGLFNDVWTNLSSTNQTVTYHVLPRSADNCVGQEFTVTVTVRPEPVGVNEAAAPICSGQSVNYDLQADNITQNGNGVASNFQWVAAADIPGVTGESLAAHFTTTIDDVLFNTSGTDETVTYNVIPTAVTGTCLGSQFQVTVLVRGPQVTIDNGPSVDICSDGSVSLLTTDTYTSGSFNSWQWTATRNSIALNAGELINVFSDPTIQEPTFTPTPAGVPLAGTYVLTYTATSTAGCTASASITVNVTNVTAGIRHGPVTPTLTALTETVCNSVNVFLDGTPAGGSGNYVNHQWSVVSSTPIAVAITDVMTAAHSTSRLATFNYTNATAAPVTVVLRYFVQDDQGCSFTTDASTDLSITVNPTPTVVDPSDETLCAGSNTTAVTFSAAPNNVAGTFFDWTNSNTGIGLAANGTGNIGAFLATNATAGVISGTITVTPKFTNVVTCSGPQQSFTITVNPRPVIGNVSAATIGDICSGDAFTVTLTNNPPTTIIPLNTTYTWIVTSNPGGVSATDQATGVAAIGQTLTNPTNATQTVVYTVTPTSGDAGNCVGAPFTVTVNVKPRPNIDNRSTTICSGTGAFTVAPLDGLNALGAADPSIIVPAGIRYDWTAPSVLPGGGSAVNGESAMTNQTAISQTLTNLTEVPQTVTYTVTPYAGTSPTCTGSNFTVTVRLDPRPAIDNRTQTICSGNAFTIAPVDEVNNAGGADPLVIVPANTTYTWVVTSVLPGGATAINGEADESTQQTNISQTLTNVTSVAQTVTYTVTPTSGDLGNCVGNNFLVAITVSPRPLIADQVASTICSGTAFSVPLTDAPPTTIIPVGTTYTWVVTSIAPTLGSVNATNQPAAQTAITQTLTNSTNIQQTVTYTVTPLSGSCTGPTFEVEVAVDPRPSIPPQNLSVCSTDPATLALVNGGATILPAGTTFTWGLPTTSGGITGTTTGTTQAVFSQTLTNTTTAIQTATYSVTPISGSCTGSPFSVVITVNPIPQLSSDLFPNDMCSGTFSYTPTSATAGAQWTWTRAAVAGIAESASQSAGYPTPGTGIVNETLTNTTTSPIPVIYEFITSANGCSRLEGVTVIVNPTPIANPIGGPATVCAGTGNTFFYNVTQNPGSTYSWEVPAQFVVAAAGSGATPGGGPSGFSPDYFILLRFNVATTQTLKVYERSADGCVGLANEFPILVSSAPPTGTITGSTTVCKQQTGVVYQVAQNPSSNFIWTATGATIVGPTAGTNLYQIVVDFGISSSATLNVTEINTAGCPTSYTQLNISAIDTPVLAGVATGAICSGQQASSVITLGTSPVVASNFNWFVKSVTANITGTFVNETGSGPLQHTVPLRNISGTDGTIVYTVIPTQIAAPNCIGAPRDYTITIHPEPVVAAITDQSFCGQATVDGSVSFPFSSNVGTATINWSATNFAAIGLSSGTGTGNMLFNAADNLTGVNISSVVTVTATADGCTSAGTNLKTFNLHIKPRPVVDPVSNVTVCSGGSIASIAFTANTGGSEDFSWTNSNTAIGLAGSGTVNIPGYTAPTNTTNLPFTGTITVTGTKNSCTGPDRTFTITVNPQPVVSASLDATVCSGNNIGLTLATAGTSVAAANYNIISRTVSGGLTTVTAAAVPQTGVGTNYLSNDQFRNTTAGNLTVQYVVQAVQTAFGTCTGANRTITITISPEPVVSNSLDRNACSNAVTGLVLNTNGISIGAGVYDIISVTPHSSLTVISSAGVASNVNANYLANDRFENTTAGSLPVTYEVQPKVSAAGCVGEIKTITITIDPKPVMASGLNGNVCSGDVIGLTLNTAGTSVAAASYNIISRTTNSGSLTAVTTATVPANAVAAGYLANDKFENLTGGALTVTYKVQPIGAINGCLGDQFDIIITIDPQPVIASGLDKSVCSGNDINLTLAVSGTSVSPTGYNIVSRTVPGTLMVNSAVTVPATNQAANYLETDNFTNTTSGALNVDYVVQAVGSLNSCIGPQRTITVTINPEPVVASTLDAVVCSQTAIGLTLAVAPTSVTATGYNILSKNVPTGLSVITAAAVPATNKTANYLAADKYKNTTNGSLIVEYEVDAIGSLGNCVGGTRTIHITIDPEPVVISGLDANICSNDPVNLTLATIGGGITAANYNIISRTVGSGLISVNTVTIPATGVAADYLEDEEFENTTNGIRTVVYKVVPIGSINGCAGEQATITMTIYPQPTVAANLNATLCSGLPINLTLGTTASSISASGYNVVSRTIATGLTQLGTPAVIPGNNVGTGYLSGEVFENHTNTPLTVEYEVAAISSLTPACVGAVRTITITINPEPVLSTSLNATVCSGEITGLILDTEPTSVSAISYNIISRTATGLIPIGTPAAVGVNNRPATWLMNDRFENLTNGQLFIVYEVVPVGAISNCLGDQMTITITVDPEPIVATNLNATVCSDDEVGLVLNVDPSSIAATNYNIVNRIVASGLIPVTQVTVPANAVADNYLEDEQYTNTTSTARTVQYIVEAFNGCVSNQRTITITINPEPVISTSLDKSVCSDDAIGLTLATTASSVTALNYDILDVRVAGGLVQVGTPAVIPAMGQANTYLTNERFTNTTGGALTVEYDVQATGTIGTGCVGDMRTIVITINPEPVILSTLNASVCSDQAVSLTLATEPAGVSALNYNIVARRVQGGLTAVTQVLVPATAVNANYLFNEKYTNTTSGTLTVEYDVRARSVLGTNCLSDLVTIIISIDPKPIVASNLNATICSDDAVNLTLNTDTGLGSVSASGYNIISRTVQTGLVPVTQVAVPASAVTDDYLETEVYTNTTNNFRTVKYVVAAVGSINGCVGDTKEITITINPEPVIATNLDKTICSDDAVALTLATNGTSVGVGPTGYNIISRTVDASLNAVTQVLVPNSGVAANYLATEKYTNVTSGPLTVQYVVSGVGTIGACPGDQRTITVTINPEPVIPNLDRTVCSDVVTGLTLTTDGVAIGATNYDVLTRVVDVGLTAGAPALPANNVSATYLAGEKFTNHTGGSLNVTYTVRARGAIGNCLSDVVTIVVTIDPEPVLLSSLNATVCSDVVTGLVLNTNGTSIGASGYNIVSRTVASGLTPIVQVPVPANGVVPWYLSTERYVNATNGALDVAYSIVPVGTINGCFGDPVTVTITVYPKPVIATNLDATVCSEAAVGLILNTNGSSIGAASYELVSRTVEAGLSPVLGTQQPIAAGVGANYLSGEKYTNTTATAKTVQYEVRAVGLMSPPTCTGDTRIITITINPEPVVSSTLNNSVCSDSPTGLTLDTEPTSVGASNYTVSVRTVQSGLVPVSQVLIPGNNVSAGYLANEKYTNTTNGPLTVQYTVSARGTIGNCVGQTRVIVITIDPEPVIPNLDASACSNMATGLTLSTTAGSGPVLDYNIVSRTVSGGLTPLSQATVPMNGVAANYLSTESYKNTTNIALTVQYVVEPRATGVTACLGDPRTIVITINPEPVVATTLDRTVCSDAAIGLNLSVASTSVSALNYNIVSRTPDPALTVVTGAPLANGVASNYLALDKFTNKTTGPLDVIYVVAARGTIGNCVGDPRTIVVTIDPEPVGNLITNVPVCSDLAIGAGYTLTTDASAVPAATFNIVTTSHGLSQSGGTTSQGTGKSATELIDDRWTNLTTGPVDVDYLITPVSAAGCAGDSYTVTVTILPEPVGTAIAKVSVCSDAPLGTHYTLSSAITATPATIFNIQTTSHGLTQSNGSVSHGTGRLSDELEDDEWTNTGLVPVDVDYLITPISADGCEGNPYTVSVTINPEPIGIPITTVRCSDEVFGAALLLTSSGTSVPASTFNVTVNAAPGLVFSGATPSGGAGKTASILTDDKWTNITNGPLDVVYSIFPVSGSLCLGTSFDVTVTINPEPIGAPAVPLVVCSGDNPNFDLQSIIDDTYGGGNLVPGNSVPSKFRYTVTSTPPAAGVSPGPNRSTATSAPITDIYVNLSNVDATITYTVTPYSISADCEGTPFDFKITVHPQPVGSTVTDPVCSTTLNHNIQSQITNGLASRFSYTVSSSDESAVPTPVSLDRAPINASTAPITDAFVNTSGNPVTITYEITPYNDLHPLCAGAIFYYHVVISPKPQGADVTQAPVCSNVSFTFDPQDVINNTLSVPPGNQVVSTFTWSVVRAPGLTVASAGTGSGSITETLINRTSGNTTLNAVYTVTPRAGTCVGNPFDITVPILPEPVVSTTLNETKCSGDAYGKILNTNGVSTPAVSYNVTVVSVDAGLTGGRPLGLIGGGGSADNVLAADAYINLTATPLKVVYSVVANGASCSGPARLVEFTVNPEPVLSVPTPPAICSRDISNIVLGTNGTSVGAASYRISVAKRYSSNGDPFSTTLPTGFAQDLGNAVVGVPGSINLIKNDKYTNTSLFQVVVEYTIIPRGPSASGDCDGDAVVILLPVNPEPALDPALSPTDICSGETIEGGTPAIFELKSAPGSVAATSFILRGILAPGLTAGPTNESLGAGKDKDALDDDSWINTTSGTLTVTYTIAPVAGVCVGPDQIVTVSINPAPALAAGLDRIVCSGSTTGILLQDNSPTSAPAGSFDIIAVEVEAPGPDQPITPGGTTLGLIANGSNAPLGISTSTNRIQNDRYINPTNDRIVVIYRIVPIAPTGMNSCRGQETQIRLTVEPQIQSVSVNAATDICSGGAVNITLQSPTYANGSPTNPVVTFSYTMVPVAGIFGATVGNSLAEGTIISDNLVNNSTADVTVNYKVTAQAATAANGLGCSSTTEDVFVLVRPMPKANNISNKTICSGDNINIALSSPTYPSTPSNIEFEVVIASADAGISGFPAGARIVVNPAVLSDVLLNTSAMTGKVTYQITPRSIASVGGCLNPAPVMVDVTVSPRPVITPIANFALCSGDTFDPKPIVTDTESAPGGAGSTLVTWSVNTAASPVTGESNGSGNTFSQTLFNNTNDKQVVIYTISARNIANSPSCATNNPVTLNVTVYPNPRIVSLPSSFNVCNNGTLTPNPYVLQSSVAATLNTRFDWVVDDSNNPDLPDLPAVTGATDINQTYVNNGEFMGTYQYTISPYLMIPASDNPIMEISNDTDDRCSGIVDAITVVNVAPAVDGRIFGFDIDGNETDQIFLCRGSTAVVNMEPTGLALMDLTYTEAGVTRTLTKLGGLKQLQVTPTTTTVYELLTVKDAYGCVANINESVTVNVDAVDNTFSVVGPEIACAPFDVQFQYNQVAGVNYTWKWLDGPDSTTYQAPASVANKVVKHRFFNPSPSSQARFRVQLDAFLDTTKYLAGCRKLPFVKEVRVHPHINAAVFPDKDVICSDERVSFVNSSQGATIHKWFYRVQGTTSEIDPRTSVVPSNYRLPNHTTSNPIVLEVVYQANNAANCPAEAVVSPITVYRGVEAGFSHTPPTVFVAGSSTANFTNTSSPIDAGDFRYEWDFGLNATPLAPTGVGPFHVNYSTPGPKEIVLIATNIAAEAFGLSCSDEFRETMQIVVPPLIAEFTVIPEIACFPTDLTVTENLATGDKFEWRVLDAGGTAASSNSVLPVFKIPSPGIYTVELVTTNSFTGDQKTATRDVTIYNLPMASFDVRPSTVYVPDGELNTFNFSDGATEYEWDFGDGTLTTEKEPSHVYKIEGSYQVMLIAKNDHGNGVVCTDTLTRKVTAKQGGVTRVPNAFTPNPNGPTGPLPGSNSFNDVFLPQVKGAEEFNMQIFDRWGNLIFESNNANEGWDGYNRSGEIMPAGVYVFKLTLRLSDGQRTTQVGDITMIR